MNSFRDKREYFSWIIVNLLFSIFNEETDILKVLLIASISCIYSSCDITSFKDEYLPFFLHNALHFITSIFDEQCKFIE